MSISHKLEITGSTKLRDEIAYLSVKYGLQTSRSHGRRREIFYVRGEEVAIERFLQAVDSTKRHLS